MSRGIEYGRLCRQMFAFYICLHCAQLIGRVAFVRFLRVRIHVQQTPAEHRCVFLQTGEHRIYRIAIYERMYRKNTGAHHNNNNTKQKTRTEPCWAKWEFMVVLPRPGRKVYNLDANGALSPRELCVVLCGGGERMNG